MGGLGQHSVGRLYLIAHGGPAAWLDAVSHLCLQLLCTASYTYTVQGIRSFSAALLMR